METRFGVKTSHKICSVFMAALLLTACASSSAFPVETAEQPDINQSYQLRAGETVQIITYGEDTLTGEFIIGANGILAFPLVGNIQAGGLTPADLGLNIAAALADGYVINPQVNVEVKSFRPIYILGEVNKPGEYPYNPDMTVLAAIAKADGFTYRAQQKQIFIKRSDQPNEVKIRLGSNTRIYPGDTIRIVERFF
ncbi:polysaccharide biosynthesis/export family protein [Parasphingorhabdus cellanae]|uniref:Polysaccharide export protein n=1 Tax=Parasphingorhabdus cellanae TaxID=2806553 RepID=A0ABX7T4W1_9SPHN|nr:polysaccharide biosynthesis/export family protein [Parasphingorhabdus cellanae]QTD55290.1 polysaccharide export protein [Parasphingorhabdus cellanae]